MTGKLQPLIFFPEREERLATDKKRRLQGHHPVALQEHSRSLRAKPKQSSLDSQRPIPWKAGRTLSPRQRIEIQWLRCWVAGAREPPIHSAAGGVTRYARSETCFQITSAETSSPPARTDLVLMRSCFPRNRKVRSSTWPTQLGKRLVVM
jgi:hypothetical protein